MSQKRFVVVNILASMLILSSVSWVLSPYAYYTFYRGEFEHLSNNQVLWRYGFSILGRLVGFMSGIGILYRNDICRKLAVILCSITILGIYWRHPLVLFEKAIARLPEYNIHLSQLGLNPQILIKCSLYGMYAVDILFASAVIFALTRRSVVEYFRNNQKSLL